jgi:hypothetical protein
MRFLSIPEKLNEAHSFTGEMTRRQLRTYENAQCIEVMRHCLAQMRHPLILLTKSPEFTKTFYREYMRKKAYKTVFFPLDSFTAIRSCIHNGNEAAELTQFIHKPEIIN